MNFVDDLNLVEKMRTADGHPWDGVEHAGSRFRKDVAAGSAQWTEDGTHLWFVCPCGCGELHCVPVQRNGNTYGWGFGGTPELPTLSPSIQITTGCRWHGYLEKGFWKKA